MTIQTDPLVTTAAAKGVKAKAEATELVNYLLTIEITTPEMAQWATDTAQQVRDQVKGWEAERDSMAKPLRKIATTISQKYKPAIDEGNRAIAHLKAALLKFGAAEQERQRVALQEATTQAEVQTAVATLAPAPAGLSTRDRWDWEVDDESLVPRKYWIIDTARIARMVRETKGETSIPGIKVIHNKTAVLR